MKRQRRVSHAPALRRLRDRIGPGVRVLFVGINPGIRSAAIGHHFAGHTNRFWTLLHESGLVPVPLSCEQDARLPEWGYGLTNLVARPTRGIGELLPSEYETGHRTLVRKIKRLRPIVVALVGVTVYRILHRATRRNATAAAEAGKPVRLGLQPGELHGARIFVLPNPSGRNAHFPYPDMLAAFRSLKDYLDRVDQSQEPRRKVPASGQHVG